MVNETQITNPLFDAICSQSFIYTNYDNPYDCLKDFFNYKDLKGHLKTLKRWRKVVETSDYFEIDTLSSPIYDHKMMCNLLNAAFLFNHQYENQADIYPALAVEEQDRFLMVECFNYDYYPKHLANEELLHPFFGIADVFKTMSLAKLHQELYNWLDTGFTPNVTVTDFDLSERTYHTLRKLIESCWLIFIRAEENQDLAYHWELEHTEQSEIDFNSREEISSSSNSYTDMDLIVATAGEEGMDLWAVNEEGIIVVKTHDEYSIPAHILDEFKRFLDVVPANRLNRSLRKMLIDYLFYNIDGLPTDFEELLTDFYWLTDLLDEIQGKEIDVKFQ